MRNVIFYSVLVFPVYGSWANAAGDKYNITPVEHQACDADAASFCGDARDEDQVLACMKSHRRQLTPVCRSAFEAGLRKRHMSL